MRIEDEIEIAAEPPTVFAVLTDPERLGEWQEGTVAVERDREGPLLEGERFSEVHRAMGRESRTALEVTAYEPPHLFALHVTSGAIPLDGRWELRPENGGTALRFTGEGPIGGVKGLLRPLIARQFRSHHRRLKQLVESER
jgi:uncharacterized protein YndB with AHSA1/START domain